MIEKYDLSFLNLNKVKQILLSSYSHEHGLITQGKSSFNAAPPILIDPKLNFLNVIIKKYVIIYCDKYNIPKLKLINSWFNISYPGNKLKPHKHEDSIVSGAFYISVGQNSVPLIFPETEIKPYSGLLCIFSSNLVHYTEEEKEERMVISFNTNYL